MADKDVSITISGRTITASPDSVSVKQNNEKVKWSCTTSESIQSITIDFPGHDWDVDLKKTGNSWSGTSREFPDTGTFKYNINVSYGTSAETLDPQVIVQTGP